MRSAFSRLDHGSLALRPAALLALLSELTRFASSHRELLLPGFRRFGRPPRRRISLRCQLGNLHRRDSHPLEHRLASLHYPGALPITPFSCRYRKVITSERRARPLLPSRRQSARAARVPKRAPEFSTKSDGRGWALAAVHGIVRSRYGAIKEVSVPGASSAFEILQPCASPRDGCLTPRGVTFRPTSAAKSATGPLH